MFYIYIYFNYSHNKQFTIEHFSYQFSKKYAVTDVYLIKRFES